MATQDDINNFGTTNNAGDLLELAATTKSETTNRTIKVATVNDLPNLTSSPVDPGTIIFVESIGIPVIAHVGCWAGLDNRELRNDCTVGLTWSWGCNNAGQLGDNTTVNKSSPVLVAGGFTDWCQVSAGGEHSLAIRTNGTLWAWGCNNCGQLGDCTNVNVSKSSPVSVVGGFNWCQVSAGNQHNVGITTNGTAWAWGSNAQGRLGDGTTVTKSSPVSVVGGFTDWCQVSAGAYHSLGVRTNGTAWAWGANNSARLGDGTTTDRFSPVSVVGGFTDWCQVSAGTGHSLGVRTNGTAWAWGCGSCGALGDCTTTNKSSPVSVVGGFTDWCQVSAGRDISVGLRTNGTLWSWGSNNNGALGDGTGGAGTSKSSPVSVVGGFTDWCQVSASGQRMHGIRTNGTAWAWGYNSGGRLGDGTITSRSSPVSVVGGFTDWCQVSAGCTNTLGLRRF